MPNLLPPGLGNLLPLAETNHPGDVLLPIRASTIAPEVDALFWFITGVTVFFTILIFALTIWFCIKYRASKHPKPEPTGHNNTLELTWTLIPTVIVLVIFFWGFRTYMNFAVGSEQAAFEVRVEGYMWGWRFKYNHPDNGSEVTMKECWIPVNTPVRFILKSDDVIHSFYWPAMRMKKDVVPGRFNRMWFTPTTKGTFDIFCTEYCGERHSEMIAVGVVASMEEVNDKLRQEGDIWSRDGLPTPIVDVGQRVATIQGCISCHSVDGTSGTGATWLNLYGSTRNFTDGTTGIADENYLLESIRYPARKVVTGYANQMQAYGPDKIPDRELGALIAYIKSLSERGRQELLDAPPATAPATQPAVVARQ